MCIHPEPEKRPPVELGDIFRLHSDAYCRNNTLTPEQYKVFNAIKNCRTSVLGGHVEQCDQCHEIQCAYNSCRNRHCPKCESFKAAQWLNAREAELLPVSYFHVVFTLPHELNLLVMYNKELLYNILFSSAWETLNTLGKDPKRLNGEMGMISILHTWGQNLSQHNHVHCIVPGGALNAHGQWKAAKKYLFPVRVLSKLFRGIFVTKIREAQKKNKLKFPEPLQGEGFDHLLSVLMNKDWVVYAKPPFASPKKLLNYLGRYTHKMVISNYRILSCDAESVTFKWRDYADDNKEKIMKLKPEEFIRRFLSHVVPSGFMRIRSFGFLANACKEKKIQHIKKQLEKEKVQVKEEKGEEKKDIVTLMLRLTGKDITMCPLCKQGKLKRISKLPPTLGNTLFDTS